MKLANIINRHLEQTNKTPMNESKESKVFVCKHCGEKFDVVQKLASHVHYQHPKAVAPKEAGRLSATQLVLQYRDIISQVSEVGVTVAFQTHPEWEQILLGRGEPRQTLYDAVNRFRKEKAGIPYRSSFPTPRKKAQPEKTRGQDKLGRTYWNQEQYDLAKQIVNDPQWRSGMNKKWINFPLCFRTHPEWDKVLNYSTGSKKAFLSFMGRVRKGKGIYTDSRMAVVKKAPQPVTNGIVAATYGPAPVPTPSNEIELDGQHYSIEEVTLIVRAARNAVRPLPFCPSCGFNLRMHSQAYSVARKHSNNEE